MTLIGQLGCPTSAGQVVCLNAIWRAMHEKGKKKARNWDSATMQNGVLPKRLKYWRVADRWVGSSFSAIGQPVYKTDPPSFDCAKASTPVERLICQDVELSSLDSQMANSYRMVLKDASAERKEIIRRQQAEWFANYSRTSNSPLSENQRRDCIDRYLSDRLITIWK